MSGTNAMGGGETLSIGPWAARWEQYPGGSSYLDRCETTIQSFIVNLRKINWLDFLVYFYFTGIVYMAMMSLVFFCYPKKILTVVIQDVGQKNSDFREQFTFTISFGLIGATIG